MKCPKCNNNKISKNSIEPSKQKNKDIYVKSCSKRFILMLNIRL